MFKNILSALLLFLSINIANAQNALNFDGVDDAISIPNASSFVINGNMSMSFWVYAKNPNPSYPDFDGIAGFRNDLDVDFYILHLATNTLEARFKNSSGVLFEIVYNNFSINSWNHLAMTYDGSELKLYNNGVAVDSVPANGAFINPSESFHMGFLPFNQPDFYLNGSLDDVCLWNKSLTAAEVSDLYNSCSMDLSDPNLKLCYQFNQGIGGGNNVAITNVIDSKNGFNGTLQNFTMNGNVSNFIPYSKNSFATITEVVCNEYISPNGTILTTSGTYTDTIPNSIGCDSIITINLTVNLVDSSATQTSPVTLMANAQVAAYQWVDCNNGYSAIPGANSQSFVATSNGNYAVIVFQNGCADTSACFLITSVGISESNDDFFHLGPNPSTGVLNIFMHQYDLHLNITIYDISGKQVRTFNDLTGKEISIDTRLDPGYYWLSINTGDRSAVRRFTIQ